MKDTKPVENSQATPDDTPVDLQEELRSANIQDVLDTLDRELIGLEPVKTRIREIAALLLVDRMRKKLDLASESPTLHMSFTGNPGTGKTTVALRMAEILRRLDYVREGHLVAVTRDDLVGQSIGHAAPKTKEVIKKAMGGVLFIDEAYYLYRPENERDYGQESIEILLQVMENNRDDLDFPDYTADELLAIAELMLVQQNYRFSAETESVFRDYITRRMQMPHFANARSIRNALDRARLRQANRLFASQRQLTRQDLMTIEAEDILASRIFSEGRLDTNAGT